VRWDDRASRRFGWRASALTLRVIACEQLTRRPHRRPLACGTAEELRTHSHASLTSLGTPSAASENSLQPPPPPVAHTEYLCDRGSGRQPFRRNPSGDEAYSHFRRRPEPSSASISQNKTWSSATDTEAAGIPRESSSQRLNSKTTLPSTRFTPMRTAGSTKPLSGGVSPLARVWPAQPANELAANIATTACFAFTAASSKLFPRPQQGLRSCIENPAGSGARGLVDQQSLSD
jgi:hypothetical protein